VLGIRVYKYFKGAVGKETEKIMSESSIVKRKGLNFKNQPLFCPFGSTLLIVHNKRWLLMEGPATHCLRLSVCCN